MAHTREITLADAEDISSGVSQNYTDFQYFTLYLKATASCEITIKLSPNSGGTEYEIDESPVVFDSSGDAVIEVGYAASYIYVESNNSNNVTVQMKGAKT